LIVEVKFGIISFRSPQEHLKVALSLLPTGGFHTCQNFGLNDIIAVATF